MSEDKEYQHSEGGYAEANCITPRKRSPRKIKKDNMMKRIEKRLINIEKNLGCYQGDPNDWMRDVEY